MPDTTTRKVSKHKNTQCVLMVFEVASFYVVQKKRCKSKEKQTEKTMKKDNGNGGRKGEETRVAPGASFLSSLIAFWPPKSTIF